MDGSSRPRNRVRNAWDSIQDADLRRRVAAQERAKAAACVGILGEEQVVVCLRIIAHPHPTDHGLLMGHLVMFVGEIPAMTVVSGSRRVD
jgi:hypothetical protein